MKKPMLATNWDPEKLQFPVICQPKIDGVRAVYFGDQLSGRSGKRFPNNHIRDLYYDMECLRHLDGEMVLGSPTSPSSCRDTTSALMSHGGKPDITWFIFDTKEVGTWQYQDRYNFLAQARLPRLKGQVPPGIHLSLIPSQWANNMEELLSIHEGHLQAGYEGTVIRNPTSPYKHGRSTVREGGLLRIKQFQTGEAVVLLLVEGQSNLNEARKNALGLMERSTHQENMEWNGMVGSLICKDIETGKNIKVSPGRMTHAERRHYLENPQELVGKTITYQHFAHGKKDAPRMPTFQHIRMVEDTSRD